MVISCPSPLWSVLLRRILTRRPSGTSLKVLDLERHQFAAAESAGEARRQQCSVAPARQRVRTEPQHGGEQRRPWPGSCGPARCRWCGECRAPPPSPPRRWSAVLAPPACGGAIWGQHGEARMRGQRRRSASVAPGSEIGPIQGVSFARGARFLGVGKAMVASISAVVSAPGSTAGDQIVHQAGLLVAGTAVIESAIAEYRKRNSRRATHVQWYIP
jgi:hypothetical protein